MTAKSGRQRRTAREKRPAPRGPLTRERLVAAALELADREGLDAVTMRRLAATLGVQAMSLYHHLPGKGALLEGLVDGLAGEIDEAVGRLPTTADWRASVRGRCLAARTVMLRHPWAPALIASRGTIPFRVFRHYDQILGTMVDGGLSYHLAHRAMHALGSMALGFVQELFSPDATGGGPEANMAAAEMVRMANQLPHVSAMVASEIHAHHGDTLGWCDSQAEFEFTLDLLLDGLERKRQEDEATNGRSPS